MSYTRLQSYLFYFFSVSIFIGEYFTLDLTAIFAVLFVASFLIHIPQTKKMRWFWGAVVVTCGSTASFLTVAEGLSFPVEAIGVAILYLMMYLKSYIDHVDIDAIYLSDYQNAHMTTFEELLLCAKKREQRFTRLRAAMAVIDTDVIMNLIEEGRRTSAIHYVNAHGLSDTYFEAAKASLSDENVYIILSDTGSNTSKAVSVFTEKSYNHVSISFDKDLKTIVSYNGGERIYPPGLNRECIQFFHKKKNASILVYSLKVTKDQKEKMIEIVRKINEEGSSYNMVGLAINLKIKTNIMYCSEFVDYLLTSVEADYYSKKQKKLKPTDFVELDYMRQLKLEEKIVFE